MLRQRTVGTGFGASMIVENVTETNHCARGNHFKHFAPLLFLSAAVLFS